MKIDIDEISKRNDPYQLFVDNIKNRETLRKYQNLLYRFLRSIPDEIYQKNLGRSPQDQDKKTLASFFVSLSKANADLATDIIAAYIKEGKRLVESGQLRGGTLANHIKPIKVLLDSNRIPIHWKSLYRMLPKREAPADDRAYTRQELQKMLEVAHDITDKVIVTLFSSGGFRVEAWNFFTWGDVVFFTNRDGSYRGGALRVYGNDEESYWTHFTPEAAKYLHMYREKWRSDIGDYPKPHQPLLKAVKYPTIHRLNANGVKKRIEKLVKGIGLRQALPEGKKRYEVPLDHGFRKYFNTMMRRAKVNYLDKEDMMGHKVGLEKHYERYQEEDFERFPEYQKAIPFLTISDEERLRLEAQQKQKELDELAQKDSRIEQLEKRIDELEFGSSARYGEFAKELIKAGDDPAYRTILAVMQLWFELRATEDEKRTIWKRLKEAKEKGLKPDVRDIFGESKGLSWKNLQSD
ncbi:MAG: site-specific integrase [Candidatus Nitrosotenuis sp.]